MTAPLLALVERPMPDEHRVAVDVQALYRPVRTEMDDRAEKLIAEPLGVANLAAWHSQRQDHFTAAVLRALVNQVAALKAHAARGGGENG